VLSGFESFLAATFAELLSGRPGLTVGVPGIAGAPAAGTGLLQVGVSTAVPDTVRGFATGDVLPPITDPAAIRAVPLQATVTATLLRRATAATDVALRLARSTSLEDVTVLLHRLEDPGYHSGAKLTSSAADPGFRVFRFGLGEVTVAPVAGDVVQVVMTYACGLFVWPPGTVGEGGPITAVDALIEAQPLRVEVAPAVLGAGAAGEVRIAGVSGSRLVDATTGAREPVLIAVGVHSELPPADRGSVSGGGPAALTGFRVFPVTGPQLVLGYTAPAGPLGVVRAEEIVVHLAVPSDGPTPGVGVRLGSVVVALRGAP
jgi:hypothetical protein